MMNTLYSFRRCPYAIRARMAILKAGVECQIHEVSLRNKPQALLDLSPKATVPVLHCADGQVIEQSLEIMQWALAQTDPDGWLIGSDQEDNLHLLSINDGVFKHWLDRYKYFERYPEYPQLYYRTQAEDCLIQLLENKLAQCGYLGGRQPCMTDVSIFPFIRQFAAVDPLWFAQSRWVATRAWLNRWLESPTFKDVMVKV
jgi:glutathione S-transferase